MIDERFSASSFAALGRSTPESRRLCDELGNEIAAELHTIVQDAWLSIADRLRAMGHDLTEEPAEYSEKFASWHYTLRDRGADDGTWNDHRLRLQLHTQVCSGYPHYCKPA